MDLEAVQSKFEIRNLLCCADSDFLILFSLNVRVLGVRVSSLGGLRTAV